MSEFLQKETIQRAKEFVSAIALDDDPETFGLREHRPNPAEEKVQPSIPSMDSPSVRMDSSTSGKGDPSNSWGSLLLTGENSDDSSRNPGGMPDLGRGGSRRGRFTPESSDGEPPAYPGFGARKSTNKPSRDPGARPKTGKGGPVPSAPPSEEVSNTPGSLSNTRERGSPQDGSTQSVTRDPEIATQDQKNNLLKKLEIPGTLPDLFLPKRVKNAGTQTELDETVAMLIATLNQLMWEQGDDGRFGVDDGKIIYHACSKKNLPLPNELPPKHSSRSLETESAPILPEQKRESPKGSLLTYQDFSGKLKRGIKLKGNPVIYHQDMFDLKALKNMDPMTLKQWLAFANA
ncbi:phosphoprotein [Kwatta virus]|uniref:Phosphoprotein n=1 Tax=Kwatta virus TaxID=1272945 RepID=A0A0D3R1B3_9RHAB|nr:phosphoprotein [Kwatta virus]AJR28292.1 phosphoprotein [Kwatta virus]